MKKSRQSKREHQLAEKERELFELLITLLPHTAQHGDMLFFNSRYKPDYVREHWLGKHNEALFSLSTDTVALRDQIGLPVFGSIGQLFLSACSEVSNQHNSNRRGPRQMAAWLLDEIKNMQIVHALSEI